uniref:Nodule-specific cysteine-rich peptide L12 n=1 Tax=Lens culinaris TaxID=3864 RepID=A0A7T8DV80_LENCU|nr:nodule-specific cysteine-rich peptide L12 [Lens culinaris]
MTKILKFIFVLITFLFKSIILTNGETEFICFNDIDCRRKYCRPPLIGMCLKHLCRCVLDKAFKW